LTFALSDAARQALQPIFDNFGYDVRATQLSFGKGADIVDASAFAYGPAVTLNEGVWRTLDARQQLGLLAHEIAHSVQYRERGTPRFLVRYVMEGRKYGVPSQLDAIPISNLNPVDPRFALDQLADRVEAEFYRMAPP
jgi:hypothetical protein